MCYFVRRQRLFVPEGAESQPLLKITVSLIAPGWIFFSGFSAEYSPLQPPVGQRLTGTKQQKIQSVGSETISLSSSFNCTILPDSVNQTCLCSRSGSREERRPRSQSLFGLHLQQTRRSINNLSHHFVDEQPCRNQLKLESARGRKDLGVCGYWSGIMEELSLSRQSPSCSSHTESTPAPQCSQR